MSDRSDVLLGAYLDQWQARRERQLRPSTRKSYRQLIRAYLQPHLGDRRLGELDRRLLEDVYANLLACGGVNGKPLSPRTVEYVHQLLHTVLQDALLDGLLTDNPARSARPPRHDPDAIELDDEPEIWTVEQATAFLRFVDEHPWRALWHLAVGTGARRGELLGLRWRDVDLEAARVDIRRALSVVDGVPRLLGTKHANRRVVHVGDSVVDALYRHEQQQRRRRDAADLWQDRWGLVFTGDDGSPIDPMAVTVAFRGLVRCAPVPVVRFHDVRHFHATVLIAAGVAPKVVSRRLGHTSMEVTMDVYGHVLPSMDGEAADRLDLALRTAGTMRSATSTR